MIELNTEKICPSHTLPYIMVCLNKDCNFFSLFCARCDFVHTNYLSDIKDLSKLFDDKDQFQEKKGAIDFTQEEFELEIQQYTRQLQDHKLGRGRKVKY